MRNGTRMALSAALLCGLPITGEAQDRTASMTRELNAVISKAVRETHFMGTVLVASGARMRYSRNVGMANGAWKIPNTNDTRFRIASVTKQFTALLIMQLVEAGQLKLGGTIADYLPWFTPAIGTQITLEQLLTHMSGVRDLELVPDYYATDDTTLRTHADVVRRFLMVAPEWKPGTRFRYNNADFIILGAILEQRTGESFGALLQRRILTPLGMRNSGLVREDAVIPKLAEGYDADSAGHLIRAPAPVQRFMASGAMYSTATDMLIWNRALEQHTLLSAASTERMFRPNDYGGALGSWQYNWRPAVDSTKPATSSSSGVRVIERQGWIGVFRALNVRMPMRAVSVIVIANGGSTDLSTLSRGSGVASAIIAAVERGTR